MVLGNVSPNPSQVTLGKDIRFCIESPVLIKAQSVTALRFCKEPLRRRLFEEARDAFVAADVIEQSPGLHAKVDIALIRAVAEGVEMPLSIGDVPLPRALTETMLVEVVRDDEFQC